MSDVTEQWLVFGAVILVSALLAWLGDRGRGGTL